MRDDVDRGRTSTFATPDFIALAEAIDRTGEGQMSRGGPIAGLTRARLRNRAGLRVVTYAREVGVARFHSVAVVNYP